MAFGLVQAVLQAHGLGRTASERGADREPARVDQVLLDGEQAPLVVALLERAGIESVRVNPVVVDPGSVGIAA